VSEGKTQERAKEQQQQQQQEEQNSSNIYETKTHMLLRNSTSSSGVSCALYAVNPFMSVNKTETD